MYMLTSTGLGDFTQIIKDILDSILPTGSTIAVSAMSLNEWIAYFIVLLLVWGVFIRPLLRAFRIVK